MLEPKRVELPGRSEKVRICGNLAGNLRIGEIEPELARPLVQGGFRHEPTEQLPLEAERARLIRGDGPAEPAAELL